MDGEYAASTPMAGPIWISRTQSELQGPIPSATGREDAGRRHHRLPARRSCSLKQHRWPVGPPPPLATPTMIERITMKDRDSTSRSPTRDQRSHRSSPRPTPSPRSFKRSRICRHTRSGRGPGCATTHDARWRRSDLSSPAGRMKHSPRIEPMFMVTSATSSGADRPLRLTISAPALAHHFAGHVRHGRNGHHAGDGSRTSSTTSPIPGCGMVPGKGPDAMTTGHFEAGRRRRR